MDLVKRLQIACGESLDPLGGEGSALGNAGQHRRPVDLLQFAWLPHATVEPFQFARDGDPTCPICKRIDDADSAALDSLKAE